MSGLFSAPKAPVSQVTQTMPPTPTDPSVQAAGALAQFAAATAKGRASTIMTGGAGVPGPATIAKKQLLGG